ncbi:MAG: L-threonylcarbamoyladenylate synthase [Candidatus Staskawiczbacteria bacterium]|nr:L-threonylcarbamoyladenylate synthase [Candidatus Staskawiczbacteria bacterium]
MEILKKKNANIKKIVTALENGAVVVCPTDTVYGFLADATNKKAVDRIYKIKKRSKTKPLPVFVKDFKMAKELAEIDEKHAKALKSKWPGKYTFILNKKKVKLYGTDKNTIALRIPKYKFLNDLLKKINKPLVQTSVNISGNSTLAKISDIIEQFGKYDIIIIDAGNLKKSKPSKIIDLTNNNKIIRN